MGKSNYSVINCRVHFVATHCLREFNRLIALNNPEETICIWLKAIRMVNMMSAEALAHLQV